MADYPRSERVIEAVDMAVWRRRPTEGVMHHSDQGSQYASLAFGRRLRETGLVGSMGSRGDGFDNAAAESFFATLECELLARDRFPTRSAARLALFDDIVTVQTLVEGAAGRSPPFPVARSGDDLGEGEAGTIEGVAHGGDEAADVQHGERALVAAHDR